jgi:cation diffusion facilitator CzcD-associated flavoprotein CzcO
MNFQDKKFQGNHSAVATREAVCQWLRSFEFALKSRNPEEVGRLFHEDCHWRDVLAFTWDLSAFEGRAAVSSEMTKRQLNVGAHSLNIPEARKPPREVRRVGKDCIEAIFEFSLSIGKGAGIVRLTEAKNGELLAWHVSTTLQEIDGHAEKIGKNRPTGAAYSRNFGGDNWEDARRKAVIYDDRDPTVLVIGGAQAGLSIAARLNQLGIDNLVVENWPRIGDSWRKRYHSLALHNSIHLNHLPYMEFPPTWPKYIPKDMLGLWFEFYAEAMEINCWTDTEFVAGDWSAAERRWIAKLRCGDGTEHILRPRHLVFANGVSSYPLIPDLPGLESFKGEVIHSEGFDSGAPWTGKRALILGTGSSANDIALDLHSFDVKTTLIQRGSTTVVSIDPSARLNESIFDEGPPLEDCDLIVASATPALMVEAYKQVTQRMLELDREMIEGLKGIGFKFDVGEDETGHQMKYFRRGGGYNLDAGSSALMIKGEIGLLDYGKIEKFVENGVLLKDGSIVPADLIVLATGYYPQEELVRRALGEEMVEKIGQVWGLGEDGELNNMFRRTPQEGLWFIAGGLAQVRINSKFLALQIKATELGLLGAKHV